MTAAVRPAARADLVVAEVAGELVLYHPGTAELHHLNPQAAVVFRCFDGSGTLAEISADIAEAFGVDPARIEPEVRALYQRLRGESLLVQPAPPSPEPPAPPPQAEAPSDDDEDDEDEDDEDDEDEDDEEPISRFDRMDWAWRGAFQIGTEPMAVRTNHPEVGAWLERHLAPYRTDQDATYYDYSIRVPDENRKSRSRGFNILYAGTRPIVRSFNLPEVAAMLLAELAVLDFAQRTDAVYLHAGLMQAGGTTILLDHAILSFLGQHWRRPERAGLLLPAHTGLVIDPERGRAMPLPDLMGVPQAALAELSGVETSYGAFQRTIVDRPMRIEHVCGYDYHASLVAPLSPGEALLGLAHQAANLRSSPAAVLAGLAKVVSPAACSSIKSTTPQDVVDALVLVSTGAV